LNKAVVNNNTEKCLLKTAAETLWATLAALALQRGIC